MVIADGLAIDVRIVLQGENLALQNLRPGPALAAARFQQLRPNHSESQLSRRRAVPQVNELLLADPRAQRLVRSGGFTDYFPAGMLTRGPKAGLKSSPSATCVRL